MIIGLTILVVAIATFAVAILNSKDGKMTSYVWGLLGYAQNGQKPRRPDQKEQDITQVVEDDVKNVRHAEKISNEVESERPRSSQSEHAGDSTPKAQATTNGTPVPTFTLAEHVDVEDSDSDEDNLPPPSFPAMNSAQRAGGGMPPPRIPTLKPNSNSGTSMMPPPARPNGLMAPPSRPIPSLRPSPAAGLRAPQGPLPNRNPTLSANSLATPITSATQTPNPRKKVLLKPGHSPLDWANLKRTSPNLSGVTHLIRVTPSLLKSHNGRKGNPCWSSYMGKVYNIGPYLAYHPGGEGELKRVAGKDGGRLFAEVHPWVNWESMLEGCLVGIMVSEGDGQKELKSELDEMD